MPSRGTFKPNEPNMQNLFGNTEASVNMSKVYVIGNITITNADGYAQYSTRVPAVVAAFGGRYRVRGGGAVTLDGQASAARHVVSHRCRVALMRPE